MAGRVRMAGRTGGRAGEAVARAAPPGQPDGIPVILRRLGLLRLPDRHSRTTYSALSQVSDSVYPAGKGSLGSYPTWHSSVIHACPVMLGTTAG